MMSSYNYQDSDVEMEQSPYTNQTLSSKNSPPSFCNTPVYNNTYDQSPSLYQSPLNSPYNGYINSPQNTAPATFPAQNWSYNFQILSPASPNVSKGLYNITSPFNQTVQYPSNTHQNRESQNQRPASRYLESNCPNWTQNTRNFEMGQNSLNSYDSNLILNETINEIKLIENKLKSLEEQINSSKITLNILNSKEKQVLIRNLMYKRIGFHQAENLETELQEKFEVLAKCLLEIKLELEKIKSNALSNEILVTKLEDDLVSTLSDLVASSFVVIEQKDLFLKTYSTNNSISIKCLIPKFLSKFNITLSKYTVLLISPKRKISTERSIWDYNPSINQSWAQIAFSGMKLNKTNNNKYSPVLENFHLEFKFILSASIFKLQPVKINVLSLPFTLSVHNSQNPTAWAGRFWDDAFCYPDLKCPSFVYWAIFKQYLSCHFQAKNIMFKDEQWNYIGNKAFGTTNVILNGSEPLSFEQFCVNNLEYRGFSFGHWLYKTFELICSEKLIDYWNDINGLIYGFVSFEETKSLLMSEKVKVGTFLIRFSDSVPGSICIGLKVSPKNVRLIIPVRECDLKTESLGSRIHMYSTIKAFRFLYGKKGPLEEYFKDYYPKIDPTNNGLARQYYKPIFVIETCHD